MNAVEFVKNQINEFGLDDGWEKVKAHLDYLISYGSEFGHVSKQEVEELKRLVNSWELIQSYKGLAEAKEYRKRWFRLSAAFNYSRANKYIIDQLDKLQNAIADVESVGGGV